MSEHAPDRILSGINFPKVIAGTLAAVSAAVVGSFLGVAGTLIGAAVASIVGSVGTEIYERSLHRGAKKLQTLAPSFIKAPAAVGTPSVAAATEEDRPSHTIPEPARTRQIRWGRAVMIAGALFVLAMGSITVAELLTGKSVESAVGGSSSGGTTVGSILSGDEKPTPTPSTAPSTAPTEEGTTVTTAPTDAVSPTPTTTTPAPATEPTTEPTTEAPATEAPAQDTAPDADSGDNANSGDNQGQAGGETPAE